jgi:hypothetical protein
LKAVCPVTLMCLVLEVSVSGFFEYRQRVTQSKARGPGPRRLSSEALVAHIRAIHAEFKGEYGWPMVWKEQPRSPLASWSMLHPDAALSAARGDSLTIYG